MIVNRTTLTRSLYSRVRSTAVCPWCGGDLEVEEELERAGETAQCVVCKQWSTIDSQTPEKLVR